MKIQICTNEYFQSTSFEKSTDWKKRVQNSVNEYKWSPYYIPIIGKKIEEFLFENNYGLKFIINETATAVNAKKKNNATTACVV